jgi:hypothetical protein
VCWSDGYFRRVMSDSCFLPIGVYFVVVCCVSAAEFLRGQVSLSVVDINMQPEGRVQSPCWGDTSSLQLARSSRVASPVEPLRERVSVLAYDLRNLI